MDSNCSRSKRHVIDHLNDVTSKTNDVNLKITLQISVNVLLKFWKPNSVREMYDISRLDGFLPSKEERKSVYGDAASQVLILLASRSHVYSFMKEHFGSKLEAELYEAFTEAAVKIGSHFKEYHFLEP